MTRDAIRSIQTGLTDLGHNPGPVDGLYGGKTRAAAERWIAAGGRAAAVTSTSEIRQGSARYLVDEIVLHVSATRPEWMLYARPEDVVAEIRRWHKANGWSDIGYHWIIGRQGWLLPGRKETVIGAHVKEANRGTIGICMIGGFGASATDQFRDHLTEAQERRVLALIEDIRGRTPIKRVSGHNEYAPKGCPGFHVSTWLAAHQGA